MGNLNPINKPAGDPVDKPTQLALLDVLLWG